LDPDDFRTAVMNGQPITVRNAFITAPLALAGQVEESGSRISLTNCVVEGPVDFSRVHFKGSIDLSGTKFKGGVYWDGARADEDVSIRGAVFEGPAYFRDAKFGASLDAHGAHFNKGAAFDNVAVSGRASFFHAKWTGGKKWQARTSFAGAHIRAGIFERAEFHNPTYFNRAEFPLTADFADAKFLDDVDFTSARMARFAIFRKTRFRQAATFIDTQFDADADFRGASFFLGIFRGLSVRRNADFRKARFRQAAEFYRADIGADADFGEAIFGGHATFAQAQVGGAGRFANTRFKSGGDFSLSRFGSDVLLERARFRGRTLFRNSQMRTLMLGAGPQTVSISGALDLHGCAYDALEPLGPLPAWKSLLRKQKPYDQQPYIHLESVFRAAGRDDLADSVYRARRIREAEGASGLHWASDRFWRFLWYGTRPWWWWGLWCVGFLLLGTLVFSRRGATAANGPGTDHIGEKRCKLHSWWDAFWNGFWVSLTAFFPVSLPLGGERRPSRDVLFVRRLPTWYFTSLWKILRLVAWVVVPLAIAGVTGLLKR
jgi:uncharacterized protein YjbI with pentapeptide repeats